MTNANYIRMKKMIYIFVEDEIGNKQETQQNKKI